MYTYQRKVNKHFFFLQKKENKIAENERVVSSSLSFLQKLSRGNRAC